MLPAGMHVIAAVKATYPEQTPNLSQSKKSTAILSSTGKIFLYQPNQIVEALFPICDVSDIAEVESVERTVVHPWKLLFWKFNQSITLCAGLFLFASFLFAMFDQFSNGFILSGDTVTSGVSSEKVTNAFLDLLVSIISVLTLGSPLVFTIFLAQYVPTYVVPKHIILHRKDGEILELSEGAEWGRVFKFCEALYYGLLVLIIIMYMPPSAAIELLVLFVGGLIFWIFFWSALHWIVKEDATSEVGELRPGNLIRFHRVLNDLLLANNPNLDESDTSKDRGSTTVHDRVGRKIEEPLARLYLYEDTLNKLTDGEWEAMLTANKFYFSLAQIRRCTEKMLYNLVLQNGIKIKSSKRGISTMLQRLTQQEKLPSAPIKWVEIIRVIANPAAHDMVEDMDDFISAFKAFVSFTSWYVDHTASEEE